MSRPVSPGRSSPGFGMQTRGVNPLARAGSGSSMRSLRLGDETGALFEGWLLKSAPQTRDTDKAASLGRRLRMAANTLKRAVSRHGDYQQRYFVLDGSDLRYYRDESARDYAGRVDLGTVVSVEEREAEGVPDFAFVLSTDAREFILAAPDEILRDEWMSRLNAVLEAAQRRGLVARSLAAGSGEADMGLQDGVGGYYATLESQSCPPWGGNSVPIEGSRAEAVTSSAAAGKARRYSTILAGDFVRKLYQEADPDPHPMTRWEELSGNVAPSRMSVMLPSRLSSVPLFAPVVSVVRGAHVNAEEAAGDSRSTAHVGESSRKKKSSKKKSSKKKSSKKKSSKKKSSQSDDDKKKDAAAAAAANDEDDDEEEDDEDMGRADPMMKLASQVAKAGHVSSRTTPALSGGIAGLAAPGMLLGAGGAHMSIHDQWSLGAHVERATMQWAARDDEDQTIPSARRSFRTSMHSKKLWERVDTESLHDSRSVGTGDSSDDEVSPEAEQRLAKSRIELAGLRGYDLGVLLSLRASQRETLAMFQSQWRQAITEAVKAISTASTSKLRSPKSPSSSSSAASAILPLLARISLATRSRGQSFLAGPAGAGAAAQVTVSEGSKGELSPTAAAAAATSRVLRALHGASFRRPSAAVPSSSSSVMVPHYAGEEDEEEKEEAGTLEEDDVPQYSRSAAGGAVRSFAARARLGPSLSAIPVCVQWGKTFLSTRSERVGAILAKMRGADIAREGPVGLEEEALLSPEADGSEEEEDDVESVSSMGSDDLRRESPVRSRSALDGYPIVDGVAFSVETQLARQKDLVGKDRPGLRKVYVTDVVSCEQAKKAYEAFVDAYNRRLVAQSRQSRSKVHLESALEASGRGLVGAGSSASALLALTRPGAVGTAEPQSEAERRSRQAAERAVQAGVPEPPRLTLPRRLRAKMLQREASKDHGSVSPAEAHRLRRAMRALETQINAWVHESVRRSERRAAIAEGDITETVDSTDAFRTYASSPTALSPTRRAVRSETVALATRSPHFLQGGSPLQNTSSGDGSSGSKPQNISSGGGGSKPQNISSGGSGSKPQNISSGGGGSKPQNMSSGPAPQNISSGGSSSKPQNRKRKGRAETAPDSRRLVVEDGGGGDRGSRVRRVLKRAGLRRETAEASGRGRRRGAGSSWPEMAGVPLAMGGGGAPSDIRWGIVGGPAPPTLPEEVAADVELDAWPSEAARTNPFGSNGPMCRRVHPSARTVAFPSGFANVAATEPEPVSTLSQLDLVLAQYPLRYATPGTVILVDHTHADFGRPAWLRPDVALLSRGSMYILLQGRVRFASGPPLAALRALDLLRHGALTEEEEELLGDAGALSMSHHQVDQQSQQQRGRSTTTEVADGAEDSKAPPEGEWYSTRGAALDGLGVEFVDVDAHSGPLLLGVSQMLRGAPSPSVVVAAQGCILLELPRARLPRLLSLAPYSLTALPYLEVLSRPDRLLVCIPALAAALADPSLTGRSAPKRAWQTAASIAAAARPMVVAAGVDVFAPGDEGDCAYVVLSGRISLSAWSRFHSSWVLLDVARPGRTLGESALVVPHRRSLRATALAPSLLLRITHASLRAALAHRPNMWRAVRNAVIAREPSQLLRLPVLNFLSGGEQGAARLAPLCDLFVTRILSTRRSRALPVPPGVGAGPVGTDALDGGAPPIPPAPPNDVILEAAGVPLVSPLLREKRQQTAARVRPPPKLSKRRIATSPASDAASPSTSTTPNFSASSTSSASMQAIAASAPGVAPLAAASCLSLSVAAPPLALFHGPRSPKAAAEFAQLAHARIRNLQWTEDVDEDAFGADVDDGRTPDPGMGGERRPLLATPSVSSIQDAGLDAIITVLTGKATLMPPQSRAGAEASVLGPGEWIGAATLFRAKHRRECGALVPGPRTGLAVVAVLPARVIRRWCQALPSGETVVQAWREADATN